MRQLALSTHPGPALAVTAVTIVLAIGVGLEPWRVVVLGLAMALGQASVGLSNDWIDADRDRAVGRTDKPVAQGLVSRTLVRSASFVTAIVGIVLTLPLGAVATGVHAVFVVSAWTYNLGLKSTPLSVAPYIVSFGILPLLVTSSLPEPAAAQWWALVAGALLGVAAHLANALPDLADDAATGVLGLPHRLGVRASGVVLGLALAGASVALARTPALWIGCGVVVALAVVCVVLVLTRPATRMLFRLIIAAALLDVAMLAASGQALVA